MDNYNRKLIQDGKLIYHLTSLENVKSILDNGLLPREKIQKFTDIANPEIIEWRARNNLNSYVPFHFFTKNPFDEGVQKDTRNSGKAYVIIALEREYARRNGFVIIPRHPRNMENVEFYDYDKGFNLIEWDIMNKRDYFDHECKQVCMAECLTDKVVMPKDFCAIYVKNEQIKNIVQGFNNNRYNFYINNNPAMFF